jgi:hypothetical protein
MVTKEETVRSRVLGLRAGELVEVRSEAEILATLDEKGELDSLPFMPEMRQFCGRRFRVYKRAVKLCDTISWTGMYRMENAVHLEGVRCDGQAHGGCQAGCNTYWKEAWLRRVDAGAQEPREPVAEATHLPGGAAPAGPPSGCTVAELLAATRKDAADAAGEELYSCQATELLRAAPTRVPPWDVKQYVLDVSSGNTGVLALIRSVTVGVFNEYQDASRRLPRPLRIRGGRRYPFIDGKLQKTPHEALDLRPGELVRVKSKEEIVRTLDANNRNRGMSFDAEMLKYCGRQARVLRRVDRIIDEPSGRMMRLKNPCIILEDVICTSDFHRLCPRAIYPYWREIWLQRV